MSKNCIAHTGVPDILFDYLEGDAPTREAALTYLWNIDPDVIEEEVIPEHSLGWILWCHDEDSARQLSTMLFLFGKNAGSIARLPHCEAYAKAMQAYEAKKAEQTSDPEETSDD